MQATIILLDWIYKLFEENEEKPEVLCIAQALLCVCNSVVVLYRIDSTKPMF